MLRATAAASVADPSDGGVEAGSGKALGGGVIPVAYRGNGGRSDGEGVGGSASASASDYRHEDDESAVLEGHNGSVTTLSLVLSGGGNGDATLVASGALDGEVRLWRRAGGFSHGYGHADGADGGGGRAAGGGGWECISVYLHRSEPAAHRDVLTPKPSRSKTHDAVMNRTTTPKFTETLREGSASWLGEGHPSSPARHNSFNAGR